MTTSDFVFDFHASRPWVSNQRMIDGLKAFGARVGGRPFTKGEFDAWKDRPACACRIAERLGSWPKALKLAGISGAKSSLYGAEDLVERLEAVWRKVGHRPTEKQLKAHAKVSAAPYRRWWGSLTRACREVARHHAGEISREELLKGGHGRAGRTGLGPGVRWEVLKRDGEACVVCGAKAGKGVRLEVDHIVPVSKGGGNEMGNLRTLCWACNQGKKDK